MATTQQVQALYIGLLGRAADQAGLNFWIQDIASGNRTLNDVQKAFAASPEFAATYGAITDRTALVSTIYSNLFERAPDAAGLAYWVGTSLSADELIASFIQYASPADRTVLNNKVLVAETYTGIAGGAATFKVADAAAVVADVNGTLASVTAGVNKIGTLPGVTAPANLQAVKAQEAATANKLAFETTKANLDALVALDTKAVQAGLAGYTTLVTEDNANTLKGDVWTEVDNVAAGVSGIRATVSGQATNVLQVDSDNKAATLAGAKQALITAVPNGAALVNAYEAAVAAAAAAKPSATAAVAAAKADLDALQLVQDAAWDAALVVANVGLTNTTTGSQAYDFLANPATTAAQVTALTNAIAASGLNTLAKNAFTAAATLAAADRADALANDNVTATSGALSTAAGTAGANAQFTAYTGAETSATTAKSLLDAAKAADALKVEADALTAAYAAVTTAKTNADAAVTALGASVKDVTPGANTADAAKTANELFYFADKVVTGDDGSITNFAKGDSLYLGTALTFNSGALSTGNNSALEFFLVKDGASTQVVIETSDFGSATLVTNPTTGAVTGSPNAAVITLTGVTIDQLSVANGVISFVA